MIEHDRLRAVETAARLIMEDYEQPVERVVEVLQQERKSLLDDVGQWFEGEAQKLRALDNAKDAALVDELAVAFRTRFDPPKAP